MKDSTARACLPGVFYNSYGWPRASLGVRQVGDSLKTVKMGDSHRGSASRRSVGAWRYYEKEECYDRGRPIKLWSCWRRMGSGNAGGGGSVSGSEGIRFGDP